MLWQLLKAEVVAKPLHKWRTRYRPIPKSGARILSKPTVPWTDFSPEGQKKLEKHIVHMLTVLGSQKWGQKLGIAANQAGLKYRMCICLGKLYINPEFTPTKAPPEISREGCYSLGEGELYEIPRAKYGWLKYQDTKGEWHEEKVKGIEAIVVQHELDHLDGKLCSAGGKLVSSPKKA
jgi:peptide deformylase